MELQKALLPALSLLAVMSFAGRALADTVVNFNDSLSASNQKQLGRLSRSGVPSDWSAAKVYPGVLNPTTSYAYKTYDLSPGLFLGGPFVSVSFYDFGNTASLFISAYAGSYNPVNKALNYLGDAGSSGNLFGTDPTYFQVILPTATDLILVVNETYGNANTPLIFGDQFNILVENFSDTSYSSPLAPMAPTPEPSTFLMLGTGLVGLVGVARRKLRA